MGDLNVEDTQLLLADPTAARAKCERDRLELLDLGPRELLEALQSLLAPVDASAASGELADFLVEVNRSGLAPGADGWWDDDLAFMAPWGFELESIRTPVAVWHGRHDRFVPFAHGQWLARHVPSAQARLSDDDGHLTLVDNHLHEVYEWLLARM
jgi:pimeloyl-ACP methyl ester carboxylesterase